MNSSMKMVAPSGTAVQKIRFTLSTATLHAFGLRVPGTLCRQAVQQSASLLWKRAKTFAKCMISLKLKQPQPGIKIATNRAPILTSKVKFRQRAAHPGPYFL